METIASHIPIRDLDLPRYKELQADELAALMRLSGARLRGEVHEASSLYDLTPAQLVEEYEAR